MTRCSLLVDAINFDFSEYAKRSIVVYIQSIETNTSHHAEQQYNLVQSVKSSVLYIVLISVHFEIKFYLLGFLLTVTDVSSSLDFNRSPVECCKYCRRPPAIPYQAYNTTATMACGQKLYNRYKFSRAIYRFPGMKIS